MIVELLALATRFLADAVIPQPVSCDSKFGNKIPWRKSLSDALEYAKLDFRPVMVIIWMDGCPSCTELMPQVANSNEIAKLISEEFSAVTLNEHRDDVKKFSLDGGYTPRIYFLSPKGNVDARFYNKWDPEPEFKFYYPSVKGIVKSMKEVVDAYPDRCMATRPCKIHHTRNDHPLLRE
ncbi:hypothetical protein GE061_005389 [Apolygus lucorum]|uniref:Uncharacterized protein n=1 Tax=Apolygus lucorum TaxID=248454 RepID=A0A6A4J0R1_APOLU|nr:hypothetical protein GE061_005389 [Apolygus lucorum]